MVAVKELPYLDLIWDEESKGLISQWKGGFIGRDIKAGLNLALEEYKKCPPGAQWIGDTTDIGVISEEDKTWIDTVWFPQFLATGVKFMAVVQPKSVIAKMSVNDITSKVPGTQLTIYNCTSLDEAKQWMKQQTS